MANFSGFTLKLARAARRDIQRALKRSVEEFGEDAGVRYAGLLQQAFRDIEDNPNLAGSRNLSELFNGVQANHIRFSRERAKTRLGVVKNPRHLVIYRQTSATIEVLRILHDSRDFLRHLR